MDDDGLRNILLLLLLLKFQIARVHVQSRTYARDNKVHSARKIKGFHLTGIAVRSLFSSLLLLQCRPGREV